jgi:hypothetical protein
MTWFPPNAKVVVVPLLAGFAGHGVKWLTWVSAFVALFGVALLEQSGAAPSTGDVWSVISAVAFGVQVGSHPGAQLGRGCQTGHRCPVLPAKKDRLYP